jgi:CheY-like chemotaxis protein
MNTGMSKRELKILHIDDDSIDAVNMQRIFRKLSVPHDLKYASNGKVALDMIRGDHGFIPDVILLDLNMPVMDGLEFLRELRTDSKMDGTLVYVLSTSDYPADISQAYAHHVAGYLIKPLSPSKFNALMERLILLWDINEFPSED